MSLRSRRHLLEVSAGSFWDLDRVRRRRKRDAGNRRVIDGANADNGSVNAFGNGDNVAGNGDDKPRRHSD